MENIWTFEENDGIETEKVDMKPFKPTGRFFEDVQTLTRMFGTKTHPGLRESSYREIQDNTSQAEEHATRDITAINFFKYRLDRNSLRTTFLCLPSAQTILTLK